MRVLLDTNALIWWLEQNPRLGPEARDLLSKSPLTFVSVISAWEIAIKTAKGRLRLPEPLEAAMEHYGFVRLAVDFQHVREYQKLSPHHRDAFDRMLIAQAKVEGLVTITSDRQFESYGIPVVWAG